MPRLTVNVSGVVFEFEGKRLELYPMHTLAKMYIEAVTLGRPLKFFVDRPSDSFAAILAYYQTGDLHMPVNVCPKAFKKELEFWNVPENVMEKCCIYRYYGFTEQLETHEKFKTYKTEADLIDSSPTDLLKVTFFTRFRRRMWKIIDYKERTIPAKVYLCIVFLMVLLGIVVLALSTEPIFQRKPTQCEMLEYLHHSEHKFYDTVKNRLGDPDCNAQSSPEINENPYWYYYHYWYDDDYDDAMNWTDTTDSPNTTQNKNRLPPVFIRHLAFEISEWIVSAFFTIDLCMRMFSCPCLMQYFRSLLNLSDILALLGFYVHLIVVNIEKEHKYNYGWIRFIDYFQIFRILRLFRIVKNVRASRVLVFSLRQNLRDMTLLVLLLMIWVSVSSCLIFFLEDRNTFISIPQAWYWSIITITTVGYGDLSPKTAAGQFLASVLAICGVLLLAITLPMFVNNFLTLYQHSCLEEKIAEKTQQRTHGADTETITNISVIKPRPTLDNNYTLREKENMFPCDVSLHQIHIPGGIVEDSFETKDGVGRQKNGNAESETYIPVRKHESVHQQKVVNSNYYDKVATKI